ncbi:MAG: FAD-dependent oxidoreductase [Bacteroidetes bacterium]|nr:FAD-dependent oxidoreductase [Bacteroidota bacterium]
MKESLAIIGTGIAGMSCAHFLRHKFDLTIYEKNDYVGGHTNTITIDEDGKEIFIDTGFMVFNHVTYPLLTKLFSELKVPTKKTSMSFSVQHVPSGLEYCGSGLNGLFAQRKNIFSSRYIKMLKQISSFNSESIKILDNPKYDNYSLSTYIKEEDYSQDMLWKYLIPMCSAVWSTPMDLMVNFPAQTLVRFFFNHGFLGLNTQHQWYTVENGSKTYRDIFIKPFKEKIEVNNPVVKVERENNKAKVISKNGEKIFDKVIFASHGDESLKMISNPTEEEKRLLSKFKYQKNIATLHTDESVMPKTKRAWSSWNYRIEEKNNTLMPSTIYWMNSLQQVSEKKNYFVNINSEENIDKKKIIKTIEYTHPLFDLEAVKAQKELPKLNESGPLYFCGSYFRYGFHEDALLSSVNLCEQLTGKKVL